MMNFCSLLEHGDVAVVGIRACGRHDATGRNGHGFRAAKEPRSKRRAYRYPARSAYPGVSAYRHEQSSCRNFNARTRDLLISFIIEAEIKIGEGGLPLACGSRSEAYRIMRKLANSSTQS